MKFKVFILLVLIASFSSCKKESQKNVTNTTETEEISLLDTLTLKLNNGEKWIVNNATQIGITKMDSIIISEAPVVPLYYDMAIRFVSNKVSGLGINPQNFLFLKRVRKEE